MIAVGVACLAYACNQTDQDAATSGDQTGRAIREALLDDLQRSAERTSHPFSVTESLTVFDVEPSRAVDGLSYHWARYAVPEPSHGGAIGAVVAARGGDHRVIKTASDWWTVIGSWRPSGELGAASACLELNHVLHDGSPEGVTTFLAQKWSVRASVSPSELQRLWQVADDSIHIDRPKSRDGTWQVTAWFLVAGPLLAGRYRCVLPAADDAGGGAQLILVDSIPERFGGVF